jgi:hypothetical protein
MKSGLPGFVHGYDNRWPGGFPLTRSAPGTEMVSESGITARSGSSVYAGLYRGSEGLACRI